MARFAGQLRAGLPGVAPVLVLAAALGGCAHQGELYEDRDWTKESGSQTGAWREVEALFSEAESDADRYKHMLRGVRHDLTMSDDATVDVRCECMDVVLGGTGAHKFRWEGERPLIAANQLALAVRTDGAICPVGTPTLRRPSIQAIDYVDGNVVVVIEELAADRPQALGAIVDMPNAGHALYLRSRTYKDRVLPYGRSNLSHRMCWLMRRDEVAPPRSGT